MTALCPVPVPCWGVLHSKAGWLVSRKDPFPEAKASLDAEHFSLASLQDSELLHGSDEGQCCRNLSEVHKTVASHHQQHQSYSVRPPSDPKTCCPSFQAIRLLVTTSTNLQKEIVESGRVSPPLHSSLCADIKYRRICPKLQKHSAFHGFPC